MGIESTKVIKRSDAMEALQKIGVLPGIDNKSLESLLYKHRVSIFDNFIVVNDNVDIDQRHHLDYPNLRKNGRDVLPDLKIGDTIFLGSFEGKVTSVFIEENQAIITVSK